MIPVRFPTKPQPRIVRLAIRTWKFYERHQFDIVLALLAIAVLCVAGAQVADVFQGAAP